MEFRTFVNHLMKIPCQIIRTGRRLVYRLLNWNRWLMFVRLGNFSARNAIWLRLFED